MKNIITILALIFVLVPALTHAQINRNTTRMASSSKVQGQNFKNNVAAVTDRGNKEITVRIASLNQLVARIQSMKNISDTQKANVAAQVQAEITSLTDLQTKINAEVGTTTGLSSTSPLRHDVNSITSAYRIYALVIPQVNILSAADRVATLATSFTTVGAKLQTRITAAQAAGKNVAALTASLADLTTKVAAAEVQAKAAITAVSALVPDNGNATIAASNKAALNVGRADIKTAHGDILTAAKDARSIVQALQSFHISSPKGASSTPSVQ